jgi:hypothetical protein
MCDIKVPIIKPNPPIESGTVIMPIIDVPQIKNRVIIKVSDNIDLPKETKNEFVLEEK